MARNNGIATPPVTAAPGSAASLTSINDLPDEGVHRVGDLEAIVASGELRILIPANLGGAFYLPRAGWPVEAQQEAAMEFARTQGLQPVLVPVTNLSEMITSLVAGRGDVIAANLTVTEARRRHIAFSVPITTVRQQVLVATDGPPIKDAADLSGKRVMVDTDSSFWERLTELSARHPDIELVPRPSGMSDEDELDAVASGRVDATLRDSNVADMYLAYRDDLRVAFSLPHVDDIAWGLRREDDKLRAALNKFLHLGKVDDTSPVVSGGDWESIKKRRVLRVLMPNNAASYFLHRGELRGFEYELAKAFADRHRLRLEVIVPETREQQVEWLLAGRADIAAGYLEPDDEWRERGAAYSRPYHYAPWHLVVHADSPVQSVADLAGKRVAVRRDSPYLAALAKQLAANAKFELFVVPQDVEAEELIAQVGAGVIDATVADGHLLDIELVRGLAVKSGFRLSEERPHAVAVHAENAELLAKLDDFIEDEYRGLVYNVLHKKYFAARPKQDEAATDGEQHEPSGRLSPYDEITRRYSEQYGFDWRLITAQMYQESRFDHGAESFAGAVGLMQVMPKTARFMGFDSLERPEDGIHAGVKYLDWVRNRFEASLPFSERLWFSLAAYNAGHGHVADARRLARQQGLDSDVWFDNTEKAMLLLAKKKYAAKARYGYVRGTEPVAYVRDIRTRYRAYADLMETQYAGRVGERLDRRWNDYGNNRSLADR